MLALIQGSPGVAALIEEREEGGCNYQVSEQSLFLLPLGWGFWYHDAESKYVMLADWILKNSCTLLPNASHQVGIGAFMVNDKREAFPDCTLWEVGLVTRLYAATDVF